MSFVEPIQAFGILAAGFEWVGIVFSLVVMAIYMIGQLMTEKKEADRRANPRPVNPRPLPEARRPQGNPQDEVEEFLRRVGKLREAQAKQAEFAPPPPAPPTPAPVLVMAEEVRPVQTFEQHAREFSERNRNLSQVDEEVAEHEAALLERFEHQVGRLASPISTRSDAINVAHDQEHPIAVAMRDPQTVKMAFVLGEILRRPVS